MSANDPLSDRERELLQLVATGASNKEIAQKLSISTNTVKVHLRNIFSKTGVVSRTEAALYAIRNGLVAVDTTQPESTSESGEIEIPKDALETPALTAVAPIVAAPAIKRSNYLWIIAPLIMLGIVIGAFALFARQSPSIVSASPVAPVASIRWQRKSPLPTARSGLAAVSYENIIYTIGGETETEITSTAESYDSIQDTWTVLQPKPNAVTDISAAVVAGKIYIPGGRQADGSMTNLCEVYDPKENAWSQVAPLPVVVAGYALTSFEGKLYLFGGSDGQHYLDTVYMYDPSRNEWTTRASMPTARAFAGVAVAGGKIYVLGGYDGKQMLKTTEEYQPERDDGKGTPWAKRAPMPTARYAMGAASVADIIHIVGGIGESGTSPVPVEYLYQQDRWQEFDTPPLSQSWSSLTLIPIESYIYAIGGKNAGKPTESNYTYRAIYTVIVPTLR